MLRHRYGWDAWSASDRLAELARRQVAESRAARLF